jgi:hypothetical protein
MKPTKVDVRFFNTTTKPAATVTITLGESLEKLLNLPAIDGTKRTQDRRDKLLCLLEEKMEEALAQIEIE